MGMFDKDKLFARDGRLIDYVDDDVPFILFDMEYRGEVDTPDGPTDTAPIVWLTVAPTDSPDKRDIVSMLGDNAKAKAESKSEGDLPALVCAKHVPSSYGDGAQEAYVINHYADLDVKGDDVAKAVKDALKASGAPA